MAPQAQPPAPPASTPSDAGAFPFWRTNVRVLFVANLAGNIGFTLYFPFIPLILGELGVGAGVKASREFLQWRCRPPALPIRGLANPHRR